MNKREMAEKILATGGSLFVVFDPRVSTVPKLFRGEKELTFHYGYHMPIPIPDLFVNNDGISATLSFGKTTYGTFVPWGAVRMMFNDEGCGQRWEQELTFDEAPTRPSLRLIQGGKR